MSSFMINLAVVSVICEISDFVIFWYGADQSITILKLRMNDEGARHATS
jgi:hypothetical protein